MLVLVLMVLALFVCQRLGKRYVGAECKILCVGFLFYVSYVDFVLILEI